ncbi:acyl-CoA dehydrogenase family protein [Mycolicibacterium vaccae]|uniref:Acyl-CoA dehydrogenase n=1 Tax=Mycolicibacterium vaccae ATCC 25954 TaxID=1194972 RepID=K0UVJ8_MYCVA|nr:acyl-CoA dehydrogenase family protein [Mycolicibacterium vaccae]ANI39996.1 acyl-CoA dehydrogenase [Mycolicibacterium vaccae 95051]EJZ09035.1 acyl-CoA dehydrogenase [Mycolicibacterium vaccae ATCC 25954]MCV7063353.1 acyl-CoA dehydrogenase family protein [Mycolicibacterium vaccae]
MTSLAATTTVADLRDTARTVLPEIAAEASDRELVRRMPFPEVARLFAEGLGTWRVPNKFGGPDATVSELIRFIIDLATADANIAQAVRSHFAFVEQLRRSQNPEQQERWFARILAGDVFGLASGETGGAQGKIATRVTQTPDGWRVNGVKYYSTGTLFADWINVRAVDEDDQPIAFVLPADRDGIERIDDWDGIGQRLTASGTTTFTDVVIHEDEFTAVDNRGDVRPALSPFFQIFLASVEVGIARNALSDAIAYARNKARPIKHSGVERSVDDPYVRLTVGETAARVYAAESAVLRAAETIDRVDEVPNGSDAEQVALLEASVTVARAQFFAVEAALKAGEQLFDVGGASAAARSHNLDRHWRNARTVASHNPRAYKASVVGAYLLDDIQPPTTGFF